MYCVPNSQRTSRDENDTFVVQDLNRSTEFQNPLLGHFFTFSTLAVIRLSTFQWIQILIWHNIFCMLKSRRTSREENDTFNVLDLNRSTEIQYPFWGHFFTFSTIAVKKYSTFQWIQILIWHSISSIPKSRRTYREKNDTCKT